MRRGSWTDEEDFNLLKHTFNLGCKWSLVAKKLQGRTENAVKNRFKSLIKKFKKQQLKKGINLEKKENSYNNNGGIKEEEGKVVQSKVEEDDNNSQGLDNIDNGNNGANE